MPLLSAAMVDPGECWRLLRASRADPPPLVTPGARRRTYGAALEQSEQLWSASRAVGEAVSPILLYYSLTQGVQAVLAARREGNGWRALPSHGLRPVPLALAEDAVPRLADFAIRDEGAGYFQQVVGLVDSPSLPKDTTLEELAYSVPQAATFLTSGTATPMPLEITMHEGMDAFDLQKKGMVTAWVKPLPDELVPDSVVTNPTNADDLPSLEQVLAWLTPYKNLAGENAPTAVVQLLKANRYYDPRHNQIRLGWTHDDGAPMSYAEQREVIKRVIDYPDGGVWRDELAGVAMPAVGGNEGTLDPLATWWAILYGMSMVARYQPSRWMRLLDADTSTDAERVREILETAAEVLPWLILREAFAVGE